MRYLMLVVCDPELAAAPEADDVPPIEDWLEYAGSRRVLGSPIADPDAGRTVRVRDGRVLTCDGPYAETKEFLAGFDLLECDSLDEALDIASRHPVARFGAIEVRAFV